MSAKGPKSDIVFSSRVRIARNLADLPFPSLATSSQAESVVNMMKDICTDSKEATALLGETQFLSMQELTELDKQVLIEKHLISPTLAEESRYGVSLLNKEESVSIMINEEDHLRIQALFPGLQLSKAWEKANEIDNFLEKRLAYAFDDRFGYLTGCPTNVGTGMRASVMIHLPALSISEQLTPLLSAIGQVGLAVRGIYGEGSDAQGHLYQVSNQITLGQTEEEIIEKLTGVVSHMIGHEHAARRKLQAAAEISLEDRIYRSYGTLLNARIIGSKEAMEKLSDVRLGIDLGLITGVSASLMNELMVMIQPGFLQRLADQDLDTEQRDIRRSLLIRERFSSRT